MGETMAASRRARAFSRLDLPALGGPSRATVKTLAQPLAAMMVVEVARDVVQQSASIIEATGGEVGR